MIAKRVILLLGVFFCLAACTPAGDVQDVFALLEYFRTRQGVYIPGEESREALFTLLSFSL